MKRRTARQSGVTLLELMIAVSLVSLLSVGMLMAIRVGLSAMERVNSRFMANRKVASVQRIIESQIGGIVPVAANCRMGGRFIFFEGHAQSMRLVSTYSLQEAGRGYPRILSFAVVSAPQGVRLIANEQIYPGPAGAGSLCLGLVNGLPRLGEVSPNPQSFVLADKLAYCRILYRQTLPQPELEKWTPDWTVPDRLPSAIRIEMEPLNPEPARLQMMPITVPIHITKWVLGDYVD
jgi:prepilin-type N-terminal cleavage/methylation domain-containing protein